ncbi:hypothetical protein ACTVH1_17315 [Gluconobacter cerinus]
MTDRIPESANENEPTVLNQYRWVGVLGEGGARKVFERLCSEGRDAMATDAITYNMAEGFSRAVGNDEGNPARFHEYIHRNVGADLPEGLTEELLYERAKALYESDELDGCLFGEMEEISLNKGKELAAELGLAVEVESPSGSFRP